MNKIKKFISWLFKSPYISNVPYSYDNKDYLGGCDVPSQEFVDNCQKDTDSPSVIGCTGIAPPAEEDREFYELIDPKGCRIEIYKDKKKEWRWRLLAKNNKILACAGEGYKRQASMRKSLKTVCEVIPFAPVEEE